MRDEESQRGTATQDVINNSYMSHFYLPLKMTYLQYNNIQPPSTERKKLTGKAGALQNRLISLSG